MYITISRWLRLTFPRRIGDVMPQLEDGRYAYICKVCVNTGTVTPGGKALLDELLGNAAETKSSPPLGRRTQTAWWFV